MLLQVAQIESLPRSDKNNTSILRDWLNDNPFLSGSEFYTWERENEKDLVAVLTRADEDPFTKWFNSKVLTWFHWCLGRRFKVCISSNSEHHDLLRLSQKKVGGVTQYSDSKMAKISTFIASVMSSILPVIAILVLYFVQRTVVRLYVTIGLTTLFASSLAIFTSARHHEIFAATAA